MGQRLALTLRDTGTSFFGGTKMDNEERDRRIQQIYSGVVIIIVLLVLVVAKLYW
jgi:hypothetical protein